MKKVSKETREINRLNAVLVRVLTTGAVFIATTIAPAVAEARPGFPKRW